MGLFDRIRSSVGNTGKVVTSEPDALRLINAGNVLEAQGRIEDAMQHYLDAIRLAPNLARAHLNHGNILLAKGELKAALDAFKTAIKHKPDYAGAYYNMGNALLGNGQIDDALASYHRALEIKPDYAEVHCAFGVALKQLGQLDDAVVSFQKARAISPDLVEAHTNLGMALKDLYNRGNVLLGNGKPEGAIASYRRALEIEPNLPEAHCNLGVALQALGQFEQAAQSYRCAVKIKPDYADAYFNLGNALKDFGQLDNAVVNYQLAVGKNPTFVAAHNNLGLALQEIGEIDDAIASYRRALKIDPSYSDSQNNLLLAMNYTASHTPAHYREQAHEFSRIVASKVDKRFSAWRCSAQPKHLRVGLVSGDLRKHSVGFFLEGLLAHIDPARIELIAYPTLPDEDELTARIRPYFSAWNALSGKSDADAARQIHADGVHVLLDLSGHTAHNRLPVFARKPAPVQVTWLGLPATTGVAEMDYVLGDAHAIPIEHESHFSETVWRMPQSYLCLTIPASPVNVTPLPALTEGFVTFASFNNLTKMSDAVVTTWSRILKSVPNSRLMLKAKQLSDPAVCEKTRQRFASRGIAPERLTVSGMLASRNEHLAAYHKVDIALDTFPYPGVTTSVEALWMGVPVLSLLGDRFLSLSAKSIAHHAGLPDWVAADQDDYVAKAAAFTSDLQRLALLRAGLREQVLASPLFDARCFARNFEEALWGMWQRYQEQQGKQNVRR